MHQSTEKEGKTKTLADLEKSMDELAKKMREKGISVIVQIQSGKSGFAIISAPASHIDLLNKRMCEAIASPDSTEKAPPTKSENQADMFGQTNEMRKAGGQ